MNILHSSWFDVVSETGSQANITELSPAQRYRQISAEDLQHTYLHVLLIKPLWRVGYLPLWLGLNARQEVPTRLSQLGWLPA